MAEAQDRNFTARLDCHYLLQMPEGADERTALVVTLHGFGGNADDMLRVTGRLFENPPVMAALQGPNQFFLSPKVREVGYGWITNRHSGEAIRLHHDMVLHVLREAGDQFGIPASHRFLAGFSQAVALNYRFAAAYPEAVRGVIALCGGLPGDWDEEGSHRIAASILHIAARQDDYYPPSVAEAYPQKLRRFATDVEFHLIDGGHRVPASGRAIVSDWMRRVG